MMIYETDTNLVRIWNGTAWKTLAYSDYTSGTVLQVVSANYSTQVSSTSQAWVTTGLEASITPVSTSSKVLAMANVCASASSGANSVSITLFRGTVSGVNLADNPQDDGFGQLYSSAGRADGIMSFNYLDSPSTTSSQLYTVAMYCWAGITAYAQRNGLKSTLTLMEIAG
jgi:hypothetical protein